MRHTSRMRSMRFQSTLSMRRATVSAINKTPKLAISIHALHEESDSRRYCLILHRGYISIHALHEESDPICTNGHRSDVISIHALHEESDLSCCVAVCVLPSISIHAHHEESNSSEKMRQGLGHISIHALHEESDCTLAPTITRFTAFQSTLSMRRATSVPLTYASCICQFQSTLSMRRATEYIGVTDWADNISIHALHEESDSAAGHFCPLFETQASCLALSISNNTADTTNNMSKTSNWLSVSF